MLSNCGAQSALQSYQSLDISLVSATCCFMSTYLGAQAIGCLIFPPYTETYGRKTTYIASSLLYAVSIIVVGTPGNLPSIILGRVLSGFVSTIPSVCTAGSIEEIWSPHERIWAVQAWVTVALLGIAVAPATALAIGSDLGWRWVYRLGASVVGLNTVLFFFTLESRPSRILFNITESLKKKHAIEDISIENVEYVPDLRTFVRNSLAKPSKMFFTEPIVFAVTVMGSTVYASAYLLTELIPGIYRGFGFTLRQGGLVFLAFALGGITFPILTRLHDSSIGKRLARQQRALVPEDKLLGFLIASPVQAISIWWFAWTIPPYLKHSPLISIAALVPLGFAFNEFDYVLVGYLCDTYTTDAGSANAPMGFIRATLIAVYPLFGPAIFKGLGNNFAASILAAVATLYCLIAFGFWKYGAKLRKRSLWARQNQRREQSTE
ncbi:hypothetical protein FKW77_005226 [Venturia effusa]|uniref:Major facilitator superfamily (MFS) profile domain-containing protein n=1 Tax=Venturia effusa TaxID=50376 RepID=A0A517L1A7_9PEZI|nr:hypothetical protein FKW77_005226 [Venturia effusa]